MTFDAAVVLFLGIIFLVWGLKTKVNPDKDVLAALKSLVTLKDEIKRLEQAVSEIQAEKKSLESEMASLKREISQQRQQSDRERSISWESRPVGQKPASGNSAPTTYSQRSLEILKLAAEGYSVAEIADKLVIGQDAIQMVLNTFGRDSR